MSPRSAVSLPLLLVEIFRLVSLSSNLNRFLGFPKMPKVPSVLFPVAKISFPFWQLQSFVFFFAKTVFGMVKTETRRNLKYGHFSIKVVQAAVMTVFPTLYTCMLAKDYTSII